MKPIISIITLLVACIAGYGEPTAFVVPQSMEDEKLAQVFRKIDAYILADSQIGKRIVFIDGETLDLEADFLVPNLRNRKGREEAISDPRRDIRLWFKQASAQPDRGSEAVMDVQAVTDKLVRLFPGGVKAALFASPVYRGGSETGFHFVDPSTGRLRVPSDRHLELERRYTPFGTQGLEDRLGGFDIHLYSPIPDKEIGTKLETDRLKRLWHLLFSMQSATVRSYTSDLDELFANLGRTDIESERYTLETGTDFAMLSLSRTSGETNREIIDGDSLEKLVQYDHFIILNRTTSMRGYWDSVMEAIDQMPERDTYLTLLYSSFAYDPSAMEYVYGEGTAGLAATLKVVDLVRDKGKEDALATALGLVRHRIEANRIEEAAITVFTDNPTTCDCPSPEGVNAFEEAERLIEDGHFLVVYDVSGKGRPGVLPPGTDLRQLRSGR